MKKLFYVLSLALLMFSCSDELNDNGKIRFTNNSTNAYWSYLDGSLKDKITGKTFVEYTISPGLHTLKVEQAEGYILFPTVKEKNINIVAGQEIEFIFP